MEEERKSEVPCGEKCSENIDREPTPKYEQLASCTTEEDPEDASVPPVEAHALTGATLVFEGCRTIGDVMAEIAMARNRFADRVVVIDPASGRKMDSMDTVAPLVQFVIINEEDAVVNFASTRVNLLLHAQRGDREACARLAEVLETLGGDPITAASILRGLITRREAGWRTSVKTLMQVGVPAGQALLKAASVGFADGVMLLLSAQPDIIGFEGKWGNTALDEAALQGHNDIVAYLLAAGANVNHANSDGDTALIRAAVSGRNDIVTKLLAAGANVNHANSGGSTALIEAAREGHKDIVSYLLAAGANVDREVSRGDTALMAAADGGHNDIVTKLLAAGVNVNHANSTGDTPLIIAAEEGRKDIVAKLVAGGANVNLANSSGYTALMVAAYEGGNDIVAELLAGGANVNYANSEGDTALAVATNFGRAEVAAKLLGAGAEIGQGN